MSAQTKDLVKLSASFLFGIFCAYKSSDTPDEMQPVRIGIFGCIALAIALVYNYGSRENNPNIEFLAGSLFFAGARICDSVMIQHSPSMTP